MLWGLRNTHWFIKRFAPVYIAGLIVAVFGFSTHASAVTISQTIADTQTNDGFGQTQLRIWSRITSRIA
jgi:hypothetical protein